MNAFIGFCNDFKQFYLPFCSFQAVAIGRWVFATAYILSVLIAMETACFQAMPAALAT
jgi:hypothetical protein